MTFCMAFSANPDGIAVIADTRITLSNGFKDGFQKIIFPTQNSVVAVAGSVETFSFVLENVSGKLEKIAPCARIDELRTLLAERFRGLVRDGKARGPDDGASIIYGDMRMEKGPTRCRLVRFDLTFSDSGDPVIAEQTGANFSATEGKKFPLDPRASELPWLCIGAIPGTRNFIGNTAMDHVRDLLAKGLKIVTGVDKEAIRARGRVYQQVLVRGRSKPFGGSVAILFDLAGASDGSFRKNLRGFVNQQKRRGECSSLDVIHFMGMAALKRIELLMTEIPGAMGLEGVSDTWSLATISRTSGIQLVTGEDPNGVTLEFGLRTGLD